VGLRDLVASGVALADNLTADLQPTVQHEAWTGNDGFGGATYATAVPRAALVERKQKQVLNPQGQEVLSEHTITLLRPIAANGAPDRFEPIDPRDRFTLPDGTTGPILSIESFTDRVTGAGYFAQVFLGAGGGAG